jgi:hypothetical protein
MAAAAAQRAQLQSTARISSGAAALRRQQGSSALSAASRSVVVRAMATAANVTKKVRPVWRVGL